MDTSFINRNEICRICHSNGTENDPLFYPCRCSGSIKYTHQACLLEWLKTSGRTKCEVCGTQIGMIPLYKPETPNTLSFYDFYGAISDIFKKYFKIWFIIFIFINIFGILTPVLIYRFLNLIFIFLSRKNYLYSHKNVNNINNSLISLSNINNNSYIHNINNSLNNINNSLNFINSTNNNSHISVNTQNINNSLNSHVSINSQNIQNNINNVYGFNTFTYKNIYTKNDNFNITPIYFISFRIFYEIIIGALAIALSIAIVFITFHLLEHLSKLEQPWWVEHNHPDDRTTTNSQHESFSVSTFISEGISVFNNWVREDTNTGTFEAEISIENIQETFDLRNDQRELNQDIDQGDENVQEQNQDQNQENVSMFEDEYPRIRSRLRLLISSSVTIENFLYLLVVTLCIIAITSIIVIGFTGMFTFRLNKISRHITSGSLGLISTNMIFNYSILCPVLYLLHTILKNYNIFFCSKIFFLAKFMLVILIEYIVTPFIYGYLLCRSTHYIKTNNFAESFYIFPMGDDMFLCYSIIGLINIFWIACILFYIHGKMRMGFLFPLSEDVDEITRFLSEILYEPFHFLYFRILKSYAKYILYFLIIQTLFPYYIAYQFFSMASNHYSTLDIYHPKIEIYLVVHSLILMFKRIHFKSLIEVFTKNWLEICCKYLNFDSFLFGRVPLTCGEEVTDRLGTYYFSSAHYDERARLTCSAPFTKTPNFTLKVYLFVFGTLLLITSLITIFLSSFTMIGFYSIKFAFYEKIESFHLSILFGIFVVLCLYSLIDGMVNFVRWAYPNRTSIKFKTIINYLLFPAFVLFSLPYINGTALRLILNKFECKGGETCLIFPSYDFIIGFILLNMLSLAAHFMPEYFIINYPMFYALRTSIRPFNSEIFIYGFMIPYLTILSSFIAIPHIIIYGFGKSLGIDANMQHFIHHNIYFWIFCAFIIYIFIIMNRMLIENISKYVKNYRYLIGHQLKNFQSVE